VGDVAATSLPWEGMMIIRLIFKSVLDPKGGPNEQVFIEAQDESGRSIDVGEWAADGEYEQLTIDTDKLAGK
jgi:hypothetical protein